MAWEPLTFGVELQRLHDAVRAKRATTQKPRNAGPWRFFCSETGVVLPRGLEPLF